MASPRRLRNRKSDQLTNLKQNVNKTVTSNDEYEFSIEKSKENVNPKIASLKRLRNRKSKEITSKLKNIDKNVHGNVANLDDENSKENVNQTKRILRSAQRLSGIKTASQKRLRNWNTTIPDQMMNKVQNVNSGKIVKTILPFPQNVNQSKSTVHKKEKNISENQVDQKCKQNVKTVSDVLAESQSQGTPFQQIQIGKYNLGLEKQYLWGIVYCIKLSFCQNDFPIGVILVNGQLNTIHYDSPPRPQRSCFTHPIVYILCMFVFSIVCRRWILTWCYTLLVPH